MLVSIYETGDWSSEKESTFSKVTQLMNELKQKTDPQRELIFKKFELYMLDCGE